VFTAANPVLEQVGSPNADEDEEDKAAGLHKPKVRGVRRPSCGSEAVCRLCHCQLSVMSRFLGAVPDLHQ
jgi:hypothetical protein